MSHHHQPDAEIAAKVQTLFVEALKRAKVSLKKGQVTNAVDTIAEFFDQQELLASYFHHRTVDEVRDEMQDRLEQAQGTLAPVFAEYPERAKQFMSALKQIVTKEFEAFQEMKATSTPVA